MSLKKTCKASQCAEKRYGSSTLCRQHYWASVRSKRELKASRAKERKVRTKKYLKSERKKLYKKCWSLMSRWVRQSKADWRGHVTCFTCPHTEHWKTFQAGHFFHGKLDFDERNLKPQCWMCNMRKNGRGAEYGMRLIKEYGLEWVNKLEADANQDLGYSLDQLKAIHADLTKKLSDLK